MTLLRAIGLMSGTSMDGIDVAMIETDGGSRVIRGPSMELGFDSDTRHQIEQGLTDAQSIGKDRDARPGNLLALERHLTDLHIEAVQSFLTQHNVAPASIDVIGFHGQTVLHRPQQHLTVQLGDGTRLARKSGIDVVYDMRAADMVAGGQGAPLVPVYHQALAASLPQDLDLEWPIAFINIGGISNITFVPRKGELIAFDTGPGNALIDQWMQNVAGIPYDQGGNIACEGGIVPAMLERYLASPYFRRKLPKSLDRNDFKPPEPHEAELADGGRTLSRLTALSIIAASDHLPEAPATWIICGGGRKNKTIMQDLHNLAAAKPSKVISAEDAGLDGDAMEAEAFAYLAVRSLKGLPLTFSATTGCEKPTKGGVFCKAE